VTAALAYNAAERLPVEIPDDEARPDALETTVDQQIRAVS
jgi:hypothetical protein